jgi:ATPase subunit of ABC transporter with duplicated ATPase domains
MLKGFGGTILTISHDRKYIDEVADVVYELTENGLVLFEGEL